jgi:serine protease inhibitor
MIRIVAILTLFLLLISCEESQIDPGPGNQTVDPAMEALGRSIEQFGWNLFREIVDREEPGKNIVISPLSIHTAISMAYNGSGGETKDGIENALQYSDLDLPTLNASYDALMEYFADLQDGIEVEQANGVFWDDERLTVIQDFLDALSGSYHAEEQELDFGDPATLDQINGWVEDNTRGKIDRILEQIKDIDVMFLINALYMKADWSNPFPTAQTSDRTFELNDGSEISVPTMFHDHQFAFHYQQDGYSAVDLPFADSTFSMTFFVPVTEESIDEFIARFDPTTPSDFYNNLQTGRVLVFLPKFEVDYKIELSEVTSALGMGIAFEKGKADFSGIGSSPLGPMYISRINHKAVLEVDESGVEGSAVTAVVISADSLPPVIDLGRPFVFVIRDVPTGTILFIGKVEVPELDG